MKNSILSALAFCVMSQGFLRRPQFCLDLDTIPGSNTCEPPSPGLKSFLLARYDDHATYSKAAAPAATLDELGLHDTAPTMVATKKYFPVNMIVNEGSYKVTPFGSKGSGGFKVEVRVMVVDTQMARGLSNQGKYDRFIGVVTLPNGKRYQIGTEGRPAYLMPAFDNKTDEADDVVGRELVFEATHVYEIELDAAVTIPIT